MSNAVTIAQQGSSGFSQAFKNRVINGDMRIDQRNNGGSVTSIVGAAFSCDRHQIYSGAVAGKFSARRNMNSVAPPPGFNNYLGLSSLSAYAPAASDSMAVVHHIEGYNIADLGWGTAYAQPVTLSFWVYSSLTGSFGGAIRNSPGNRSYPFAFSIPVANIWTFITITIPGDTAGTWYADTNSGIQIWINTGSGTAYKGPPSAWASADYRSATSAVDLVATNAAVLYITGIQFEEGTVNTAFDYRSIGNELNLCLRYFYTTGGNIFVDTIGTSYNDLSTRQYSHHVTGIVPVPMRTNPAVAFSFNLNGITDLTSLYNLTVNNGTIIRWRNGAGSTSGQGDFYVSYSLNAEL